MVMVKGHYDIEGPSELLGFQFSYHSCDFHGRKKLPAPLQVELGFQLLHLPHFVLTTHLPLFPRNHNLKTLRWGKEVVAAGTFLVIESRNKGLTVEEIVDELRSKNREYVRLRRQTLIIKVKQIIHSLSEEEEESEGTRKKQRRDDSEQRNSDLCISSSASSASMSNPFLGWRIWNRRSAPLKFSFSNISNQNIPTSDNIFTIPYHVKASIKEE